MISSGNIVLSPIDQTPNPPRLKQKQIKARLKILSSVTIDNFFHISLYCIGALSGYTASVEVFDPSVGRYLSLHLDLGNACELKLNPEKE